jgi:hypothetical protein
MGKNDVLIKYSLRKKGHFLTVCQKQMLYFCPRQFLQLFLSACGVRFVDAFINHKAFYRAICYFIFCTSLVPVLVFANLFPASLCGA